MMFIHKYIFSFNFSFAKKHAEDPAWHSPYLNFYWQRSPQANAY